MKKFGLIISIAILIILSISCKKDSGSPEIRITKIIKTSSEGNSIIAAYSYNQNNQLVKVQYLDRDENFSYNQDGSLHKYISNRNSQLIYTFQYKGNVIDYVLVEFTKEGLTNKDDTISFSYDPFGHISMAFYNFTYYPNHTEYICDNAGNITRIVIQDDHDSTWLSWDNSGNLIQSIKKARNYETGGYESYTSNYHYDNGLNFKTAAHYPKEFLFLNSLNPHPTQSRSNCVDYNLINYVVQMESGIPTFMEYNEQNYPVGLKFLNSEFSESYYEFVYEKYQP